MRSSPEASAPGSAASLTVAGLAALLSSACCVVPLVFALVGVSGAWIANLRVLEPYSGMLTALAATSLAFAGWRIFGAARPADGCDGAAECQTASPATRRLFWGLAALTVLPIAVQKTAHFFY